jgi:hypothetical protein
MCIVWISEQTAIISLYNINWLVCITDTECVYCAVRSVLLSLDCITDPPPIISLYNINWLVCITETECVYCAVRTVFMCFVWISEQTAILSLYNINWLVCITETECVYCAVRTESLNTGGAVLYRKSGSTGQTNPFTQSLTRCAMAQAVSRQPLKPEACLQSQNQFMWDLRWTTWQWDGFWVSPVSVIPPTLHVYHHLRVALTRRANGRSRESSKTQSSQNAKLFRK